MGDADGRASDVRLSVGGADHRNGVTCSEAPAEAPKAFSWTPELVVWSVLLFFIAGLAEIGGGWLIFQAIRVSRPFWWGILGSLILVIYGFIPTLQPISNFGRVFAVYGGWGTLQSPMLHELLKRRL
jgi:drug/metabolite transporter superfamily protein YnfA